MENEVFFKCSDSSQKIIQAQSIFYTHCWWKIWISHGGIFNVKYVFTLCQQWKCGPNMGNSRHTSGSPNNFHYNADLPHNEFLRDKLQWPVSDHFYWINKARPLIRRFDQLTNFFNFGKNSCSIWGSKILCTSKSRLAWLCRRWKQILSNKSSSVLDGEAAQGIMLFNF